MTLASELAALFRRDLTRTIQQLQAFPDDATLWQGAPGMANSAGNLVLHLEGNLREFIGRQLGGQVYQREREREFSSGGIATAELIGRMEAVREMVPQVVSALSTADLEAIYPENVLGSPLSTQQFLIHLTGHLNYHLGQIDCLRRILTQSGALQYARL